MMRASLTNAFAGILLTACAATPPAPEPASVQVSELRPALDSLPAEGLPPQTLDAGECGLFLWSKSEEPKYIFFSKALSERALFAQDETPLEMYQTRASGDIFGQFNTRMEFASSDGRQLSLSMVPGDMMNGGQRLESGIITLTDREGWQTKLPVLGVWGCQPE
ncbi:MAG: hypothetical protein AAGL90_10665 [Pseudomonadota bacterium]